jgi:SAM-dependent methyltransferase
MDEFCLSRVMRPTDYTELAPATAEIDKVLPLLGGWNTVQHQHRKWEYAMALFAANRWALQRKRKSPGFFTVADFGCGIGILSPVLAWMGNKVSMYEIWTMGNEEAQAIEQMNKVSGNNGSYEMVNRALGGLQEKDFGKFDASFCISTIEHTPDHENAFREFCQTVKPGGLLFLTMDFADNTGPHFADHVRCRIGTKELMHQYGQWGSEMGMSYFGGTDWEWTEASRMVYDFGFGSLAMVKNG